MSKALELIASAVEATTGKPAKRHGDSIKLVCTHEGAKNYNLSAKDGNDRVILHCFSRNCDPKYILERAGLDIKDIYHQQLTPAQRKTHKTFINDRELKKAMYVELLILMAWLTDCENPDFHLSSNVERKRLNVALGRIRKVTRHFLKAGV